MSENHSVPRDQMPPGGISGTLFLVDETFTETRPDEERLRDQTERGFDVHICLTIENTFSRGIDARPDCESGSSFFRFPPHVVSGELETTTGRFRLIKNNEEQLSGLTSAARATSAQEATKRAIAGVSPFLDHLSYKANVPVSVARVTCVDSANRITSVSFTAPYAEQVVNPHEAALHREMIPIYALYREAKNSTSPFYTFLCYYKILDGVLKHLRPTAAKKARTLGVTIQTQKETIPDDAELRRLQPEYVGRRVGSFVDEELRPKYRNAVAHFALDSGKILNPSDYAREAEFSNVLLATELSVRAVVDAQNSYYDQLSA